MTEGEDRDLRERARAAAGGLAELRSSPLGRRFLLVLSAALTACSLAFLVLFVVAYRARLLHEHTRASVQITELLRASLENAMLKRDLPGLRSIIQDLGHQRDIATVMILNPATVVRFSSDAMLLDQRFADLQAGAQPPPGIAGSLSVFTRDARGREVLRTFDPVHNQARCTPCHGALAQHPVNGILVVDYPAGGIRRAALGSALLLAAAGGIVLFAVVLSVGTAFVLLVLRPVRRLADVTSRVAAGELGARVRDNGADELALLARNFDTMADRVGDTIERLQSGEAFLQSVIDAMPDAVRVIADDHSILKVNRAYCAQQRVTPADCVGRPCYQSSHARSAPCSPTMVTCPLVELAGPGAATVKCRHRHVDANGRENFVEVSAARAELLLDGVRRHCVIESIRNLADQTRLSHEQRLSEIGQLAAGVAHEIHNPLSSIQLALAAIRDKTLQRQHAQPDIDPYLAIVDREIDRCITVTGRLLRLSEPPAGTPAPVDVDAVVRDVAALVTYQAAQAGVSTRLEIGGRPCAMGSESDLGILVLNLVQNALHAMPQGGTLSIEARDAGGVIDISVSDTGIGIAPEDLPRIFWPFWSKRADGTHGTGLGLAICKATVEQLGGTIDVQSTPGRGSRFLVRLPAAATRTSQP
jgi:signal transduction histidine kinase/HAMP domain-containing protein